MQQSRRGLVFSWPILVVGCSGFEPRDYGGPSPGHAATGIAGFSYDAGAPEGGKAAASPPSRPPDSDWGPATPRAGEGGAPNEPGDPNEPSVTPPHRSTPTEGGAAGEGAGGTGAGRPSGGSRNSSGAQGPTGGAPQHGSGGSGSTTGSAGHGGTASAGHGGAAGGASSGGEGGGSGEPVARAVLFSEYVEGSSTYKALELRGVETTRLDGCSIVIQSNGQTEKRAALDGELHAGHTSVLCTKSLAAVLGATCDRTVNLSFNGNDAITLECDGVVLDSIGQLDFDPGTAWSSAGVSTANQTLRRRCSVTHGDAIATDPFDPSVEWASHPTDDFSGLGSPDCE